MDKEKMIVKLLKEVMERAEEAHKHAERRSYKHTRVWANRAGADLQLARELINEVEGAK